MTLPYAGIAISFVGSQYNETRSITRSVLDRGEDQPTPPVPIIGSLNLEVKTP